jgi:hypothetical protein
MTSRLIIITICLFLTGVTGFSQTKKTPVKSASIVPIAAVSEISAVEWGAITKTLETEDWAKSALLSSIALQKLKTDNEKKQLAALRYFYLYSLAGKVQAKTTTYAEFEKISQAFIGKDFLMPNRQILADCTGKVNYICAVKNDPASLRVTATNRAADSIIFFEYLQLNEPFDFAANNQRKAFLSGRLKKVESEVKKNNLRVIRLFFENGKAEIVKS